MDLIQAIKSGNTDYVKYVFEHTNFDINHQDQNGETALIVAVKHNMISTVKYLLEMKADPNIVDHQGITALSYANNPEMVKLLVDNDAIVDFLNERENTALIYGVEKNPDVFRQLIASGADVNHQNIYGDTALLKASSSGNHQTVTDLIRHGAKINHQNKHGNTALMIAVLRKDIPIIKTLLKSGADPTIKNRFGKTAHHLAADDSLKSLIFLFWKLKILQQENTYISVIPSDLRRLMMDDFLSPIN